jgi:flagellin-like protein
MNKNMIGKKGVSAIVATVLIILITVAAVTIIWAAIVPMINNQLDKGLVCLDAVSQVQLKDEGYTCIVDDNLGNISLQIGRGSKGFELVDIQILLSVGGNTESINLVEDTDYDVDDLPGANGARVFSLEDSDYSGVSDVEIAPVISMGNAEEVCEISSKKTLIVC